MLKRNKSVRKIVVKSDKNAMLCFYLKWLFLVMQSASQQASILNKKIHRKKKEQESAEAISGLKIIKNYGPNCLLYWKQICPLWQDIKVYFAFSLFLSISNEVNYIVKLPPIYNIYGIFVLFSKIIRWL